MENKEFFWWSIHEILEEKSKNGAQTNASILNTFNNNYPDHMEEVIEEEEESYNSILSLIDKYQNNNCTKEDYENILFHLWQSKSD